jgi:hypothetical protein
MPRLKLAKRGWSQEKRFSPEPEFNYAAEYCEGCHSGLGMEFAEEVYTAITRIIQFPGAWSPISTSTRRCLVHRFPYGVIYQVTSDTVRVIAIADLRRRPGYWKKRE